jgi:hypothetical protein
MKLELEKMNSDEVVGIYTIKGKPDRMPESALYLHPEAASSWRENNFADKLVVSDMLRTAESSLKARRDGRGAQRPGYSGHNYGLSIDLDVGKVMTKLKLKKKVDLDLMMESYGWYCHRRDHDTRKSEMWHFNFLGIGAAINPRASSTAGNIEAEILRRYGASFILDSVGAQTELKHLRYYGGDIDGIIGPRSKEAIAAFQRAWELDETQKLDHMTMRTLAFVGAIR